MADTRISQLTDGGAAQSADQIPINRSGVNFSLTAGHIAALSPSPTFSTIAPGTNTGALVIGPGGSLTTSGAGTIVATNGINSSVFAGLGTPANGTVLSCSDCTLANPCAGSGTGAIAERLNGVWVCNGGGVSTVPFNIVTGATNANAL